MNYLKTKKLRLSVVISIMLFSLLSCRVQYVPVYQEEIKTQIVNTSEDIDQFYLSLLEVKQSAEERTYNSSAEDYVQIQVQLRSLLQKNRARIKNEETIKIVENALKLWERYKSRHKSEGTINNADIHLNMRGMEAIMLSLLTAELAKENAK